MTRRRKDASMGRPAAGDAGISQVRALLEYGRSELGLDFAGSFERLNTRSETANWLYVSHPFRIESALRRQSQPMRFKFSWDQKHLKRSAAAYRGMGFDTYLFMAEGHGGGRCPVTTSLLASSPARRGYVVIHEGWHSTLHREDVKIPYPLEEATGRAIGCFGIIEFARKHADRELLRESIEQEKDWAAFAGFVNRWHRRLTKTYKNGRSTTSKHSLMEKAGAEAARLAEKMTTAWEPKELGAEMNNAFFLRYYDYTCYYPAAARVARAAGSLRQAAQIYKDLQNRENPFRTLKSLASSRRAGV